MLACFQKKTVKNAIPIEIVPQAQFAAWLKKQSTAIREWLKSSQFRGEPGCMSLLPDAKGKFAAVILCVSDNKNFWSTGSLPLTLPEYDYYLVCDPDHYTDFATAWALGAYQFDRYKKATRSPARLVLPKTVDDKKIENIVSAVYLVRDLINTPADDMGPSELAAASVKLAKQYNATVRQLVGDDLLKHNYRSIHTVGRASDDPPRLIDIRWGRKHAPSIVLVGKGVCFDTGGLNIKPSSGMLTMKKDMGGAAHVLGLARMIMGAALPVNLRVLIPVVENAIGGNAYRPGDVIKSRAGLTIEIGNTDAEGRVVLADALCEAVSEKPDLIIDMSTLTGAARVALGTELPAVFSNHDETVEEVIQCSSRHFDPIWRLPLFDLYREELNSTVADLNNNPSGSYGGAITAGLFLQAFVPKSIPWLHYDLMAWNLKTRPGRPQGGEAMGLRGLFAYLNAKYG